MAATTATANGVRTAHGFNLLGPLKYPSDFAHLDYADPDAPKGGSFRITVSGSFDNLNPYITIGTPAIGAFMTYDTLMQRSGDEPASVYGLVAESIGIPDDVSFVDFKLRANARWHDGKPITPEDVIFTLETLKTKGTPALRANYRDVARVEKTGAHAVRFVFEKSGNRALAATVAEMPVLPKHYWESRDFTKPTLEPPLTSGPYRIASIDLGRSLAFERVKDYWAKDLPIKKGRHNFDAIRHDYYRDVEIQFEAFKAGHSDFRFEAVTRQWAKGYDFPAVREGKVVKEMLQSDAAGMYQGFNFNLRREKFQDARIREALAYAFDFEWTNKNLFYDVFTRTESYFPKTDLSARGLPEGKELALLERHRDALPPRLFAEPYRPPSTGGTEEGLRRNLRHAMSLLREAGWTIRDGRLLSPEGQPLEFEIILFDPTFQLVTSPFIANLKRLGIAATMRVVDSAQYARRMEDFDFDVTVGLMLPQPATPRTEQRELWGSQAADEKGSRNSMGIKNSVVDDLIEDIIYAPDRESAVAAVRALDRVLLWSFYSVPHYHMGGIPVAYWNRFGRPDKQPTYLQDIFGLSNWWIDPAKDAALGRAKAAP